jgi:hypothetical protein
MEEALWAVAISKPWVLREMPRLLRRAGLRPVETQAHVYAEIGTGRFLLGQAETFGPLVARVGLLSAEQVEAWLAEQLQAIEQGLFFGACNY